MQFYESIADHYDKIFPFNSQQKSFIQAVCPSTEFSTVLDVGCGTGTLCTELVKDYLKVTGIDPDVMMLRKAIENNIHNIPNLQFLSYGMLDLAKHFKAGQFDIILSFGNSLVHLTSEKEILEFLIQARMILKPGSKLLIQIINYDRIIEQQIKSLPTIENDQLIFKRDYHYDNDHNIIHFKTSLQLKEENHIIKNQIPLYPVRKDQLEKLLLRAGFENFTFFSSFNREIFHKESIPLVIEAM